MSYTIKTKCKIVEIKRLNNSYNGNPNFKLTCKQDSLIYNKYLDQNNNNTFNITTMNDYGINYKISDNLINKEFGLIIKANKKTLKLIDTYTL